MPILYKVLNGKKVEVNEHMMDTYKKFGIKGFTSQAPKKPAKKDD